jgi:hypothetical protein
VDLVGLFQLLAPYNHTGISWEKDEILLFLNNNSLIVLETLRIMDVMVDYPLKHFNILKTLVVLNLMLLIHTLVQLINVFIDLKSVLAM